MVLMHFYISWIVSVALGKGRDVMIIIQKEYTKIFFLIFYKELEILNMYNIGKGTDQGGL
jgi:hypothetical protein